MLKYFITELNFPQDRLSTAGYAEFRPIDTNDTAEGRASNRRVEIKVTNFTFISNDSSDDSTLEGSDKEVTEETDE